jgi:mRNA interferase MazF
MTIQPGEFWVADIPFTNVAVSKKRPVLVLWLDGPDVVAAAVTIANPRSQFDVALIEWKSSGLRRGSTVRLSRLDCLEQSPLVGRIRIISDTDAENVRSTWAAHVKPRF